ncbi:uncharacterized protein N7518_001911 [Penicillium psychrosexuale]|uniref:uncharacterized protein n=1 Tax=Penicillium psychrosexuale TaxID=1002107 RepID=UPI002545B4DC|nr:uncharacterized protein N7518_001911 [Penicillium psychrosexuale]KAJ5799843.1 hypothetical protein N7518_001911 [Penicillium psychrosexuale]
MSNPETASFLCGLEGTDVTPDPPSEPPLHLPRQTWAPKSHVELTTLKALKKLECDVVPDFLAY